MRKNRVSYWNYRGLAPRREYPDPRIAVARHIGWQKNYDNDTAYSVPEPDNYNRCFLMAMPTECKFIEDQVIYKGAAGWLTLLYVPEEQLAEYDAWIKQQKPLARWQHHKTPDIKEQRFQTL